MADVVEFHADHAGSTAADAGNARPASDANPSGRRHRPRPFPVEYKRGRPKAHNADRVQLCAQALCLEEMLDVPVGAGALFYGRTRRREDVSIDAALRRQTEQAATRLHALIAEGQTPTVRRDRRCDRCSMLHLCLLKATGSQRRASGYLRRAVRDVLDDQPAWGFEA